jgi:hypothetical protein
LRIDWGTNIEPEIYHYVYKDTSGKMSYALSIQDYIGNPNVLEVSIVTYNNIFVELSEDIILSTSTNGKNAVEGEFTPLALAKWFRLRFKNTGAYSVDLGGISYWRNRIESHIHDSVSTTGAPDDVLTRKDYVDAGLALKQDNLSHDGTTYLDSASNTVGQSLMIIVNGNTRYIPSSINPTGSCHSNCHSNCEHSDCGDWNAW